MAAALLLAWAGGAAAPQFDPARRGSAVTLASDGSAATWDRRGCNQLTLLSGPATASFWVELQGADQYVDVGLCDPSIDLNLTGPSPADWMGDQVAATGRPLAWIYRRSGVVRVAAAQHAEGRAYGRPFGSGSNVSVVRHSATELEFGLDGVSQGRVHLSASQALPADAVGCVGVCVIGSGKTVASLRPLPPAPPPPPPPPPAPPQPPPNLARSVLLTDAVESKGARCLDGSPQRFWVQDAVGSKNATKWVVRFMGGAWCTSMAGCAGRAYSEGMCYFGSSNLSECSNGLAVAATSDVH